MYQKKLFTAVAVMLSLLISCVFIQAAGSQDNPVVVQIDGVSGDVVFIPYIYIKNTSTVTYECLSKGNDIRKTYSFEDSTDFDYNDVTITTGVKKLSGVNYSLDVTLTDLDASYDHSVYLKVTIPNGVRLFYGGSVYSAGGHDIKIFDSSQNSLGSTAVLGISAMSGFEFRVSPAKRTLSIGQTSKYKLKINFPDQFTGDVNFRITGMPAGVDYSVDPNPLTFVNKKNGESVLNLTILSGAVPGEYEFTAVAEAEGIEVTDTGTLVIIGEADFVLTANPALINTEPGFSEETTIGVDGTGGFTDEVSLFTKSLPDGFKVSFTPEVINGSGFSKALISISDTVPDGRYNLKIFGKTDSLEHSKEIVVNVSSVTPEVSFTKSADKSTIVPGEPVSFTLKLKNEGDVKLEEIVITDELDSNLEFLSGSEGYAVDGAGITFTLNSLEPGAVREFKINTRVREDVSLQKGISNFAVLDTLRIKGFKSNTITLKTGTSSLTLVKSLKNANPNFKPGGIVIYELVLKNRGTVPVYDLKLTDTLPSGFYYIKGRTVINGKITEDPITEGSTLLWKFKELTGGQELRILYQVSISSSVKNGRHINSAVGEAFSGSGEKLNAGPSQAVVTVSRGAVVLWSSIAGTVFEDKDGDGEYGAGDKPVSDIQLILDGGGLARSDKDGDYLFDSILPGEHVVSIDPRELGGYEAVKEFFMVSLIEGAREYLNIPLKAKPEGTIQCVLKWLDEQDYDSGLSFDGVRFILDDEYFISLGTDNKAEFQKVPSGKHKVKIDMTTLPGGMNLNGESEVEIEVNSLGTAEVIFELTGAPFGAVEGRISSIVNLDGLQYSRDVLYGLKIFIDGKEAARTDSQGTFKIEKIPIGEHVVTVDMDELKKRNFTLVSSQEEKIKVESGRTRVVEFKVKPLNVLKVNIDLAGGAK